MLSLSQDKGWSLHHAALGTSRNVGQAAIVHNSPASHNQITQCGEFLFFAHLPAANIMPWHVLGYIRLTDEDNASSSWIIIKILFQELADIWETAQEAF
ncbi:hypothetical protein SLEP1_g48978 [Rubroshorea leprosula]|uniref:Uncharacterized protein n=1 Tax=Rubroshorea leprosula TaxID=152421 RepID=A0AAV5LXP7_9ROSI|nr:hypothetical protein SLEP1_g48978 [Rubroshorea leprosula]